MVQCTCTCHMTRFYVKCTVHFEGTAGPSDLEWFGYTCMWDMVCEWLFMDATQTVSLLTTKAQKYNIPNDDGNFGLTCFMWDKVHVVYERDTYKTSFYKLLVWETCSVLNLHEDVDLVNGLWKLIHVWECIYTMYMYIHMIHVDLHCTRPNSRYVIHTV